MSQLTVLYDERCNLCCRIRAWLQQQPKYVQLNFIAADSVEARALYPHLDHELTLRELHVIHEQGQHGQVYRGAKAWLMCLWALRAYRGWALRLATPELMPLALRLIARVSNKRYRFARYSSFLRS